MQAEEITGTVGIRIGIQVGYLGHTAVMAVVETKAGIHTMTAKMASVMIGKVPIMELGVMTGGAIFQAQEFRIHRAGRHFLVVGVVVGAAVVAESVVPVHRLLMIVPSRAV